MPSLEKPCFLLPHGSERSNVYVCIPVDPGLATKSPVIETLMEFDGLVEMPEGVSLEDFAAWAAMIMQDPSQLSLEELSLALQVSDKLSAHNSTQLAAALAARLKGTDWSSGTAKEAIVYALLRLGRNMQQLVFREAGKLSADVIFSWPMLLQLLQVCDVMPPRWPEDRNLALFVQAYSDLWVTRAPSQGDKASPFTISERHRPASVLRFLDLLSRTDPALPGLSSLSLPCAIPTAEAADLLCCVLLHHSKLANIHMPRLSWAPCSPSPPAATVFRTLPQLTGLTSLTLSAPCLPVSPTDAVAEAAAEAVQAMAAAIAALPQLEFFHLSSTASALHQHGGTKGASSRRGAAFGTAPSPKRRRIASCMGPGGGAPTPPSLDPVIAALSTALSLISLRFDIPSAALGRPLPCSGIRGAFRTLKWLQYHASGRVDPGENERPPPGMEVLDTSGVRLPALLSLDYTNTSAECTDDIGTLRRMLNAKALHPTLESVDVRLGAPFHCSQSGCKVAVFAGASDTRVSVCVERGMTEEVSKVLQSSVHSLTASATALTIDLYSRGGERLLEGVEHVAPIVPPLATFSSLQTLEVCLDLQSGDIEKPAEALSCAILAQSLQPLRLLTSLHMVMPAQLCKPLSMVAKQMQGTVQLRSIFIEGFQHGGAHEFQACFAPLTTLTQFQASVRPVTAELVRAWAGAVSAMPQLRHSCLRSCDGPALSSAADRKYYADVDWCRGLLELPSRGSYELSCCNSATPPGELEAVRQQLLDRGADVSEFPEYISFDGDSAEEL